MIPLVGFLPAEDSRVRGTLEAIQSQLAVDGLIRRYSTDETFDGLPPGEGAFLPCSFWLVDNLVLAGRHGEATAPFERLLSLCNDVGLIAEEYDTEWRRLVGNFPQAMTHAALINAARNLSMPHAPNERRAQRRSERPASLALPVMTAKSRRRYGRPAPYHAPAPLVAVSPTP